MNGNCTGCNGATVRGRQDHSGLPALVLGLGFLIAGFASVSSAASLTKISGFVPGYYTSTETSDMPTADFDGDGLQDIVVIGTLQYSDAIQIVGMQAGLGWKVKQAIVPDSGSHHFGVPNIATWTDAVGAHLLYVRGNLISIFGGWPLTLEQDLQLDQFADFSDVRVADVDNDGVVELIAASRNSNQGIEAYSLTSGVLLWQYTQDSSYYANLHIAQLDADPALEILLTGAPGTIIDGATHALEWQYKDGFGPFVEDGRFGGSSPRFASLGYRVLMFQSQPWSPLWDLDNAYSLSSAVADIDGDQIDELINASDVFPNAIQVIDVQTQSVRSSFNSEYTLQLAAADFDGDEAVEIAIGRSAYYSQPSGSNFRIVNGSDGVEEYSIPFAAPGPFVVGGLIADAGSVDLIFGSASGSAHAGTFTRMDSTTGVVRWRTPAEDPSLNMNRVRSIKVATFSGQPQPVIVASGDGYYPNYHQIAALRSSDGGVLWLINSSNSTLPVNTSVEGLATIDLNGDESADALLACTSEPRLRMFSVTDQSQLWSSVAMTGICRGALQMPSNGNQQLVAILSAGLRAYDIQSHLLSWSLPYPYGLMGATYLPHGASGPELALFTDTVITFYDAESRTMLRELSFQDHYPIQAVAQPSGASIHDLAITLNGRLHVVDGISGTIHASSEPLGLNAGLFNQLAAYSDAEGSVLMAAGSDVAVSTYRLSGLSDAIFANGFESAP